MEILDRSLITSVNYGEVLMKLGERSKVPIGRITRAIERTGLEVAPIGREVAARFPAIRSIDRAARTALAGGRPLALADLCCLAFAKRHGLPVVTADRYWADLGQFGLETDVVLIR